MARRIDRQQARLRDVRRSVDDDEPQRSRAEDRAGDLPLFDRWSKLGYNAEYQQTVGAERRRQRKKREPSQRRALSRVGRERHHAQRANDQRKRERREHAERAVGTREPIGRQRRSAPTTDRTRATRPAIRRWPIPKQPKTSSTTPYASSAYRLPLPSLVTNGAIDAPPNATHQSGSSSSTPRKDRESPRDRLPHRRTRTTWARG